MKETVDAFHRGRTVFVADLDSEAEEHWPGFAADASDGGAAALFAFPLRGGNTVFGVLELYRASVGELSDEFAAVAQLTADVQGPTAAVVKLGPFGGAQDFGVLLWPFAAAYVAAAFAGAAALFARRDL